MLFKFDERCEFLHRHLRRHEHSQFCVISQLFKIDLIDEELGVEERDLKFVLLGQALSDETRLGEGQHEGETGLVERDQFKVLNRDLWGTLIEIG